MSALDRVVLGWQVRGLEHQARGALMSRLDDRIWVVRSQTGKQVLRKHRDHGSGDPSEADSDSGIGPPGGDRSPVAEHSRLQPMQDKDIQTSRI